MKYEIYQLKEDTMEQVKLRFMASDQAAQLGGIHRENYRLVYEGNVETRKDAQQTLDGLFRKFNIDRPAGFEGHSRTSFTSPMGNPPTGGSAMLTVGSF